MLLSPGHSPRHIASPPHTDHPPAPPSSSSSSSSRKRPKVLDEDTYVAAIEKIIERDYFPDIRKLRDRLDWLEAVRSGDPVLIRDAQLKIIERRGGKTPGVDTDGRIRTPGSTFFRTSATPFETPGMMDKNLEEMRGEIEGDGSDGVDESVSLDEFFRRYTSEDNDSFNRIMEKVNRKKKERYGYLLEGEKKGEEEEVKGIEDVKRDRITDGYGTSDQPTSTLEGWNYEAKNLLMYHPADRGEAPLTEEERAERLKGLTKEINKGNTRFRGKMMDTRPMDDDTVEVLYTPVAGATPMPSIGYDREREKLMKYDLEDLRKTPNPFYMESEKKAENGYGFVRTPSPMPGADGSSPFVTWGEIEGTPMRLEPEDTPLDIGGSADGPHFKIPGLPSRDLKAHSLSREAARKIRERTKMFQKPPLSSPVRSGSASPSVKLLSPAAQKFVRNAIAKTSGSGSVDESLRASYRGASPSLSTPKPAKNASRLGTVGSIGSRSPSVRDGSNPPW